MIHAETLAKVIAQVDAIGLSEARRAGKKAPKAASRAR